MASAVYRGRKATNQTKYTQGPDSAMLRAPVQMTFSYLSVVIHNGLYSTRTVCFHPYRNLRVRRIALFECFKIHLRTNSVVHDVEVKSMQRSGTEATRT